MKKFVLNTIAFFIIFFGLVLILAILSSNYVYKRGFENWEAESNLLMMKSDYNYDLLIMGVSHARNFSRHKNHLRLEKALHRDIINIGIGGGICGVNEQLFYLQYFYNNHNNADTIIYILSPTMMTKGFSNKASNTFQLEPFRFDFLVQYLNFKADNKYQRIFYYLKSKFSRKWLNLRPRSLEIKKGALEAIDSTKILEGLQLLLVDNERIDEFQRNCSRVEETIRLAKEHHSKIIFFIPPALFGKWQGHNETMEFLKEMNNIYDVDYFDFSESVLIPKYYYDHHHLNSAGVDYFTENYLKNILK